jgi:hypothetical protein
LEDSPPHSREGLGPLLDDILRRIDWGHLVPDLNPHAIQRVRGVIRDLGKTQALVRAAELTKSLVKATQLDPLEVQAVLDQLESQHAILRGPGFVNLAPERLSKEIAGLLRRATETRGVVTREDVAGLRVDPATRNLLMEYLEAEQRCIALSATQWVFPHVVHARAAELDDLTRHILDSGSVEDVVPCERVAAAGSAVFHQFQILFSREHGPALEHAELFAVWVLGAGKNKTALMASVVPGARQCVFRLKAGGARGAHFLHKAKAILADLNRLH